MIICESLHVEIELILIYNHLLSPKKTGIKLMNLSTRGGLPTRSLQQQNPQNR